MINYSKFELPNGLRVLVHEDSSTPMVAVNVLYDVGSRDENADKTGFAHLFEHLMFGGSENVTDFDNAMQLAGGENNAFTNNDITNYYDILPANNLEVALWLEADRMRSLNLSQEVLDVQKSVVVEEFKETCLNQPYGDVWHQLSNLVYKVHPYRWPTIGLIPEHIADARLEDVRYFFETYYRVNNAILSIAGNVQLEQVKQLTTKWFGNIAPAQIPTRKLTTEPSQTAYRELTIESEVPVDSLYMAFRMPNRTHPDFYTIDLLSDLLCNGRSSRLYRNLLREQQLFSQIDCYLTGSIDPGLFMIEGKLQKAVSFEQAEAAIWKELEAIKEEVEQIELQKVKNRVESNLVFSEVSTLSKAMNLAFYELIGNTNLINEETILYQQITPKDIERVAKTLLQKENCSVLRYVAK